MVMAAAAATAAAAAVIIIIKRRRTTTTRKINQMVYVQHTNTFGENLLFRTILNNDLQLM